MYKKTIISLVVVCFLLTMIVLGVSIAFGITNRQANAENERISNDLENVYKRNYYELSYELSNAGDSLNKLLVTASPSLQQKLLTDFSDETASAVICLSILTDTSSNGEKTVAFINKAGDYAKSLNYKLALGKALSNEDKDNLTSIYNAIISINQSLSEISDKIEDNYKFLDVLNTENDLVVGFLNNIEVDIKYPSLIYDGPFSDALEEKKPSLTGEELDAEKALQEAKSYMPMECELEKCAENSGDIPTYVFVTKNLESPYYVSVAKKGGWLVSITSNITSDENNCSEEEAVKVANDYLLRLGIPDMEAVWVSDYNSIYFINFVYKQSDVLAYPDMIKIKVSAKDKSIVGVEALNYIYNHKERQIQEVKVSKEEAEKKVESIEVETVRLAIIPSGGGSEQLCWEVAGKANEDYYFIYISAESGEEVEVFRVVDSEQGKLLI